MRNSVRIVGSVLLALLIAGLMLAIIEVFSATVHPYPNDFGGSREEVQKHIEEYPRWSLALVVPMWMVTTFLSVLLARILGGSSAAIIVGLILVAGAFLFVFVLPYPVWFEIANILGIPAATFMVFRLYRQEPKKENAPPN